jgi:FSR family fosmidomycin resistance protein-like MFS transporter
MTIAAAPATMGQDIKVISLVGFVHGASHFFHFVFPSLFPFFMVEFGLSFVEFGSAMTLFFVVSGIGQSMAGILVDRIGPLRVLCGGIALMSLSTLVLAAAPGAPWLFVATFIAGLGNAIFHPADFALLNLRVSTGRLGHAFSMHGLSGNLGWASAPPLMVGVATAAGWRSAALTATGVGLAVLAVALLSRASLRLPRAAPAEGARPHERSTFAYLHSLNVWLCFAFFITAMLAFGALQNFAPPLLGRTYAMSLAAATTALTSYIIATAAGAAVGGFIASRPGSREGTVALALGVAALLALALATRHPPQALVAPLMAAIGFCVGLSGPSRDVLIRRTALAVSGDKAFGRVYGFTYSGFDVGLATAPLLFGALMDSGRHAWAWWMIAAFQLAGAGIALAIGYLARHEPKGSSAR